MMPLPFQEPRLDPRYLQLVAANRQRQPDDPGVKSAPAAGAFHVDFAAHDAALAARTWQTAFWLLLAAAAVTALIIGPYMASNWQRITHAVACTEEVV